MRRPRPRAAAFACFVRVTLLAFASALEAPTRLGRLTDRGIVGLTDATGWTDLADWLSASQRLAGLDGPRRDLENLEVRAPIGRPGKLHVRVANYG